MSETAIMVIAGIIVAGVVVMVVWEMIRANK